MQAYRIKFVFLNFAKIMGFLLSAAIVAFLFQNCSDQKFTDSSSQVPSQQGEFDSPNSRACLDFG